jgi:S1-C subfamily serine protease
MDARQIDQNTPQPHGIRWLLRLHAFGVSVRRLISRALPFASGVCAAFLALLLYRALVPQPQPLTQQQVNETVAKAMASATPAPALSALVYQAIHPSLVLIQTQISEVPSREEGSLGSGVIINADGLILTSLHVIEDAAIIDVIFADGSRASAHPVATLPEKDIAVLAPDQLPSLVVPAILGNPAALHIGDEAFAVGNPFGLYGSLSAGVVSGLHRTFQVPNSERQIEELIQIDAAVNPGNSGGPLLNRYGQVVGIIVGIVNPTDQEVFIGIGFAVPIDIAASAAGFPQY